MKSKIIITITGIIANITAIFMFAAPAYAEENPLFFRAVNAGYSDDNSSQNYDFIEIGKRIDDELELSGYRIEYYNSSDKLAGEIEFADSVLQSDRAVFGFDKSPQFLESSPRYVYSFGSSGLASTAGRLVLMMGEETVDEICWGKIKCEHQFTKFATKTEDNYSAIRCFEDECEEEFTFEKYYPEINEDAIVEIIPEPESEPEPEEQTTQEEIPLCSGIIITELYSYHENSADEQFIEIFNTTDALINLEICSIRYKNKTYPLQGIIEPQQYVALHTVTLTKNPNSSLTVEIIDAKDGVVDAMSYDHGQKKGTSVALIDGQ